jgi:hypothetical protein
MADKKISDFTAATAVAAGDFIEIENAAGNSRKVDAKFAGIASGTSFPGSPASGDRFYRSDRNIEYFYDGMRWLSTEIFTVTAVPYPGGLTNSTNINGFPHPFAGLYDIYALDFVGNTQVTATATWTCDLYKLDGASATNIASFTTSGDTINVYVAHRDTIDAVVASSIDSFQINITENTGTATFYAGFSLTYRLVG